jgi:hypothetical protein
MGCVNGIMLAEQLQRPGQTTVVGAARATLRFLRFAFAHPGARRGNRASAAPRRRAAPRRACSCVSPAGAG